MKPIVPSASLCLLVLAACANGEQTPVDPEPTPVPPSEAVFTAANEVVFDDIIPDVVAFGTVAGDREAGAHGTFVRIPPGQATPLHTHGAAYNAVVLQGNFENPIPGEAASDVVLTTGSFYSVPAGAEHVTQCAPDSPVDCLSFFYQAVPFDFAPVETPAEDPMAPGAVFITASSVTFDDIIPGVVAFGTVAGDREAGAHGTFVRIPPGEATPLHTHGASYDAVILDGNVENPIPGDAASDVILTRGSYYFVPAGAEHITRCAANSPTDCLTFFYQDVAFDFAPVQ